jgi:hypothetical protein
MEGLLFRQGNDRMCRWLDCGDQAGEARGSRGVEAGVSSGLRWLCTKAPSLTGHLKSGGVGDGNPVLLGWSGLRGTQCLGVLRLWGGAIVVVERWR